MNNKGYIVNRLPLFKGEKFNFWKQRMIAFFELYHNDLWDVVENENYMPLNEKGEPLERNKWSNDKKTKLSSKLQS